MPGRGGGAVIADEQGTESTPGWDVLSDVIRGEGRRGEAAEGHGRVCRQAAAAAAAEVAAGVLEEVAGNRPRIPRDGPMAAVGHLAGGV